jgi:hypothetical protein
MQKFTEQSLAVSGVCCSVKDVRVPEFIDRSGWADLLPRVPHVQRKEHAIESLGIVAGIMCPLVFFDELSLDHRKVEGSNPL